MTKPIIHLLQGIFPLSARLKKKLESIIKVEELPKKYPLLKPGQVASHAFFVITGMLRGYRIGDDGEQISYWFMKELNVVIDVISFFGQKPSKLYIETMEPSLVGYISYEELQDLYRDFPTFNINGRILTERYYVLSEERTDVLRACDAREKYGFFLDNHADLIGRVPWKHIASYLGLSERILSKVRNGR